MNSSAQYKKENLNESSNSSARKQNELIQCKQCSAVVSSRTKFQEHLKSFHYNQQDNQVKSNLKEMWFSPEDSQIWGANYKYNGHKNINKTKREWTMPCPDNDSSTTEENTQA